MHRELLYRCRKPDNIVFLLESQLHSFVYGRSRTLPAMFLEEFASASPQKFEVKSLYKEMIPPSLNLIGPWR